MGVPAEVAGPVIPAAIREVADHLPCGARPDECFCHQAVDHSSLHAAEAVAQVDFQVTVLIGRPFQDFASELVDPWSSVAIDGRDPSISASYAAQIADVVKTFPPNDRTPAFSDDAHGCSVR